MSDCPNRCPAAERERYFRQDLSVCLDATDRHEARSLFMFLDSAKRWHYEYPDEVAVGLESLITGKCLNVLRIVKTSSGCYILPEKDAVQVKHGAGSSKIAYRADSTREAALSMDRLSLGDDEPDGKSTRGSHAISTVVSEHADA